MNYMIQLTGKSSIIYKTRYNYILIVMSLFWTGCFAMHAFAHEYD